MVHIIVTSSKDANILHLTFTKLLCTNYCAHFKRVCMYTQLRCAYFVFICLNAVSLCTMNVSNVMHALALAQADIP